MSTRLSHWVAYAIAGAAAALAVQAPALAGDVSVSVNLAAPGLYGQINIGGDIPAPPAPELILPRAVVAVPVVIAPGAPPPPPLYLHVPPGHERHWARHCHEYDACGRPVYFVSDRWYNEVYTPRYRGHDADRGDGHRDEHYRHEDHGRDHDDHGDHGHGHGHDHDR